MKKVILLTLATLIFLSCGEPNKEQTVRNKKITEVKNTRVEEKAVNNNGQKIKIARYSIAAIMKQQPDIISVKKESDYYIVSYKRPEDNKEFIYKIKFDGNRIIWGNADGRWRDTKYDEKITYEEKEGRLGIVQKFEDGSSLRDDFIID